MLIFIQRLLSLPRTFKQFLMVALDIIMLETSIILSYSLRQAEWFWPDGKLEILLYFAPALAVPIFYFFGLYHSVIRYIGIKVFLIIIYSVTVYILLWAVIGYVINIEVPRSVLIYHVNGTIYKVSEYFSGFFVLCIINWLICLLLIGSSRIIARQVYWGISDGFFDVIDDRKNVIIYGAGSGGVQLSNSLYFSKELKPIAFIDDDESLISKQIGNIKVYHHTKKEYLVSKYNVKEVLIAIPSITKEKRNKIIDRFKNLSLRVSSLPGIDQIVEGKIRVEDRKQIKIADILGRSQVDPVKSLMDLNTKNKSILVTGAGGSIGSQLCFQLIKLSPKKLILFELNEFSLYNVESILKGMNLSYEIEIVSVLGSVFNKIKFSDILKKYKINTIYHTAAYKHVPMVENNILEAFKNNVLGTLYCAEAAIENKVESFVLISSDKAVRPTSFMGGTKRIAEMIIQNFTKTNTKFSAVRFGNVLGSSGSVIPLFEKQIESGGPVTITHEKITRYFMTVEEASELVIQAGAIKAKGNIFFLDMGNPIKIIDLAKKMIELSGLTWELNNKKGADINIIITGLRSGEKLFEELAIGNNTENTIHPKIISIKENFMPLDELKKEFKKFKDNLSDDNILFVRKLVNRILNLDKKIQ